MKKILFLLGIGLCVAGVGCNYQGVPVEFANTCDKANDNKTIEVTGFFNNTGSAMCSRSGNGPMRCPVDFVDMAGRKKDIVRSELDLGSGASSIENVDGQGLRIHDDKGELIENSQKVKITAVAKVFDTPRTDEKYQACYVVVKKLEKAL